MSNAHGASANGEAASEFAAREDGFRVSLNGACLPDLVQMACLSRSAGAFRVVSQRRIGYLFFRDGQVVHALVDDVTGIPAALEMLKWNTGTFEPSSMPWPTVAPISLNWQNLLLLAARQSDEAGKRAELAPSPVSRESVIRPTAHDEERGPLPEPVKVVAPPRPAPVRPPPRTSAQLPSAPQRTNATLSDGGAAPAAPGVSVRVSPEGAILTGRGACDELAQIGAYAARLAQLIGEAFGMEGFSALESVHDEHRRLVHVDHKGGMVALTVPPQTDVGAIRQKFGL